MGGNSPDRNSSQSVISFDCGFCGRNIRVPGSHAGKKGRCPKCKSVIVVPQVASPVNEFHFQDIPKTAHPETPPDTSKKEPVITREQELDLLRQSSGLSLPESSPPPQRKYPWLIDIFLYPANIHGLIFMGIAFFVPFLLSLVIYFLFMFTGVFAIFVAIPSILITIVIAMYAYWFIAECIRDSAEGNLRVPDTMAQTPGLGEMFLRLLRLVACFVVCAAPAYLYYRHTGRIDLTCWLLGGCGVFVYPLAILAVVMFDSIYGLNPFVIIPSIFSSFFQYCGLVIFVGVLVYLFIQAREILLTYPLMMMIIRAPEVYLAVVTAHLIGRFYFRYQEKLNWDV